MAQGMERRRAHSEPDWGPWICLICGSEMEIERVDASGVDVVCTAPECSFRARYDTNR